MELSRDELAQRLRIASRELDEWVAHGLVAPLADRADRFPEDAIEEGELVRRFRSLGYGLGEISKIKRSVGLPVRDEHGRYVSRSGFLTIGELAERSGINARTIKFWEEKGLIAPHRRTEGGFRLYRPSDVGLIAFIRDLQAFNYSLAEIGPILRLVRPTLGVSEEDIDAAPEEEILKVRSALEFLVGRMREVREASTRVEAVFARRLREVSRLLRDRPRSS
jgi:DNA-binding transcriptional MerR regulator